MKEKVHKEKVKKPLYKKWWFWGIIVVILLVIFVGGGTEQEPAEGTEDGINSTQQQSVDTPETTDEEFIEEVKTVIQGAINHEKESITDVVLEDKDLCVKVDLSKADPSPLTLEDLAISRTSSITDAILDLTAYDSHWDTITIDFGEVGKVINSKESMSETGRYFPGENLVLE